MRKLYANLIIFISLLIIGAFFIFNNWFRDKKSELIPSPQVYESPTLRNESVTPSPILKLPASDDQLPAEINLDVPFTSQAPHQNWEDPYGEFCEEASVLMAVSYVKGWDIPSPDIADKKLWEIKSFEEERFGYYKDTTAEETAEIIRELYGINEVLTVYNPSVNQLKDALSEKKVIIIPAAGRQLGNPYFRQPGPVYHMLVIKGYTRDGNFITNDPGTRRGANYIYSPDIIMNAIHDWNNGEVESGKKIVIIVG